MVMDFWAAQRRAKKRTTLCVIAFIFLTLVVACISEVALRVFAQDSYDPPLPYMGMAFLSITFIVALFQYTMYSSQGGSYVAESMGGIRLTKENSSAKEIQLLNIVEEIALASSVPIPAVYLINAQEINAFAAGLTPKQSIIAVTVGALQRLNRDELQGVIAHEFGHIHNGDMLISMRLAAMVMGFYFVLYIAMRLMQFSGMRRDDRRENGQGGGGNVLALAAIILVVAGAFTWFMGSILKCMVSRQREYLADASSVQFTRNPESIANALRKIAGLKIRDMPTSGIAYSHMYFEDSSFMSSLFATHPPVRKRIAAIEGRTYMEQEEEEEEAPKDDSSEKS